MNLKVSILIPCLNEQKTIARVINKIKIKLPHSNIYVFDNNSTDNSVDIAKKAGAKVYNVVYKGKGNVVRRMFADIEGDVFVMIDADDTYDVSNVDSMIGLLVSNNLDMIVGKRISNDSNAYRFGHLVGNKIFSNLVKFVFGNQIDDLFSGYRVFSRKFVKSFPGNSKGFEIETELTIHALEQRLPIDEVECQYFSRPKGSNSKLNTLEDGLKILNVILVLIKDEKPLLFFSLLSLFFIIMSLSFGVPVILDFFETGKVDKIPSAILAAINMVIAFLSFFSGLILDVIKKSRHERKRMNYLTN